MKLLWAQDCGFCFGVRNAVAIAQKEKGAYTYGHIIHNEHVIESLRKSGVHAVESIDGLQKGDTLILRSHGAPQSVYEQAEAAGLRLIDATCPFVKKIHKIVSEMSAKGYYIVIVGKASHPEVIGIQGWCGESAVIDETTDISALTVHEKVCVVAQTTFESEK
ncbi:MAG: 4-hydroxy-3-methylbut-2-enyl diphosphate reductase, partial [Clostridiales bacterium]|nr:4-hydroxy-3-methylbut-2-enyl diphosphate reductase [Clostridiales bacterium]